MRQPFRIVVPTALAVAVLGFIWFGVVSPGSAPAQERRPIPVPAPIYVRWEYRLIAYHPVLENMEKELDKAGQDGWEVCGSTTGAVQHILLKRPRR